MSLKQLIKDVLNERDTKCSWHDRYIDEKNLSEARGLSMEGSYYLEHGCDGCTGYDKNCQFNTNYRQKYNFGNLD